MPDERRGCGRTNWDDLLIGGILAPASLWAPLCCSAPLILWAGFATGWLQSTECWWETAVWRPPPTSPLLPPTPPCHMIKGIPRGTQKHGWGYFRQEESETITTACTVCVCACTRMCVWVCMLIDRLILSYNSNSNQITHLFLLSCEVQMSPFESLDYFLKPLW